MTSSPPSVLFYASGHGYGHARRCGQVIRALHALDPSIVVHARTIAPADLFGGAVPHHRVTPCRVDAGAAERSPLEIDGAGTLRKIQETLSQSEAIVAEEVKAMRRIRPRLVIADVPFLAGDVAEAVGVPCVALSNFTWDWIVEPFADQVAGGNDLVRAVGDSYRKMLGILRLPLGGMSDTFRQVINVPLIAGHRRRPCEEVLRQLGVSSDDRRTRALFAMRGAIPTHTLAAAAASMPDVLLICPTNEPGSVPAGVFPAAVGRELDFSDVVASCDVVVGKLGYGLVSDCIASDTALLWPRRSGFREDGVVEREGASIMRMRELPLEDFAAGRWSEGIRAAAALPAPPRKVRSDGADVCGRWIAEYVAM